MKEGSDPEVGTTKVVEQVLLNEIECCFLLIILMLTSSTKLEQILLRDYVAF
jgi:hypothetical protein